MVRANGIDHIVLHVTDVARAKKFYMSFRQMESEPMSTSCFACLAYMSGVWTGLIV